MSTCWTWQVGSVVLRLPCAICPGRNVRQGLELEVAYSALQRHEKLVQCAFGFHIVLRRVDVSYLSCKKLVGDLEFLKPDDYPRYTEH